MSPIELTVRTCTSQLLSAYWPDGEMQLANIPECWLDLMPFLLARLLFGQGYDPARLLIVRLQGADYELMRAPLGVVAASPRLNPVPVEHPAHRLCEARHAE